MIWFFFFTSEGKHPRIKKKWGNFINWKFTRFLLLLLEASVGKGLYALTLGLLFWVGREVAEQCIF